MKLNIFKLFQILLSTLPILCAPKQSVAAECTDSNLLKLFQVGSSDSRFQSFWLEYSDVAPHNSGLVIQIEKAKFSRVLDIVCKDGKFIPDINAGLINVADAYRNSQKIKRVSVTDFELHLIFSLILSKSN